MINIKKVLLVFSLTLPFLKANPAGREFRASWVITWEYIGPSQSSAEIMTRIDEIMDNHAAANNLKLTRLRLDITILRNSKSK